MNSYLAIPCRFPGRLVGKPFAKTANGLEGTAPAHVVLAPLNRSVYAEQLAFSVEAASGVNQEALSWLEKSNRDQELADSGRSQVGGVGK